MTQNNWYNYFHAGDMYQLTGIISIPEKIVAVSPVNGIIKSYWTIPNNPDGDAVAILTPYTYKGNPVRVEVFHITKLYGNLKVGSEIVRGQPLAIQETIFTWGKSEQALDIDIRVGKGSNYPLASDFNPNAFIAAYDYLTDDLRTLVPAGKVIVNDTGRDHCNKSGHIP